MNYYTHFTVLFFFIISCLTYSQKNLNYQQPRKEILDLVNVDRAPSVLKDDKNHYMVFVYRPEYKSIDELSQKEMRLGGLWWSLVVFGCLWWSLVVFGCL